MKALNRVGSLTVLWIAFDSSINEVRTESEVVVVAVGREADVPATLPFRARSKRMFEEYVTAGLTR